MGTIKTDPVFPIPAFYTANRRLSVKNTLKYVDYLYEHGARNFMTTAGTTQYNLLSVDEITQLNLALSIYLETLKGCEFIAGCPIQDVEKTIEYIKSFEGHARFLVIYPDRLYDWRTVVDFFESIATRTWIKPMVHMMPIRSGKSQQYIDYDNQIVNEMLEFIFGAKEECADFTNTIEICEVFEKYSNGAWNIVAGGSQSRLRKIQNSGADASTFLAGAGSLFPIIDINKNLSKETTLFKITTEYGWHPCMRESIHEILRLQYTTRQPFYELSFIQKKKLMEAVEEIKHV